MANRSRARKVTAPSGSKGKGAGGNSGTVSVGDGMIMPPAVKTTFARGKVSRTPTTYDVEKCVRWKPHLDVDESVKAELGKLPKLLMPWECPGFGVIGASHKLAHHVVEPYMTFSGDRANMSVESTTDHFEAMLDSSTEMLARLSFVFQAVIERETALEKKRCRDKP